MNRKLAYTWEMIRSTLGRHQHVAPQRSCAEAVDAGVIPELRGYETIRREVKVSAHTRLDLCLEGATVAASSK